MKVKKFRIKPRLPVVGRILKSLLSTKKLDPQLEESLPLEIQSLSSQMVPVAFYQTWSAAEVPPLLLPLLSVQNLGKSMAVSAVVATAGSHLEDQLSDCLMKGETLRSHAITAIGEESADLAYQFITRLLEEDAESDDCVLSEPVILTDQDILNDLFQILDAQSEGVSLDTAGHLSPRFTRVALLGWSPLSKKKRSITTSHKRST